MISRKFVIIALLLTLFTGAVYAQDDDGSGAGTGTNTDTTTTTTTNTTTTQETNYTFFGVICDTQAVVNLDGFMGTGYDIYYQVFTGAQGTGTAVTSLRQVSVSGQFSVSDVVTYNTGSTIAASTIGSFYVTISREGNPDSSTFSEYVDDVQDGCASPSNPTTTSTDSGSGPTGATGTTTGGTSNILSPFGGVINPNYVPPAQQDVVLGVREDAVLPRQQTPGIIFAECDSYPVAEPGLLYDNDQITIFWSWFARTPEQVQDHIDNVNYSVTYYFGAPVPNVIVSDIQQIGGNYWVFYYAQLNTLSVGDYLIEYYVTWDQVITDGYDDYGPGTDFEFLRSRCSFEILPNTAGQSVNPNPWPYQGR